jgi:hypothetical protein
MEINPDNHIFLYQSNELLNLFENENNLIYSDKCIEVQRSLDPEHLQEILKYQVKYYQLKQHYFYPTPIIVCKLNDKYTIIDGQHRYESIKTLTNLYKQRDAFTIPVSVILVETKEEIVEYFKIINMNKPIPSMILEDTTNWLQVSKGFEKYLYDNFSVYNKSSDRPHMPHLNFNKIMDYIHKEKVVERGKIKSSEQFIKLFDELNIFYKNHNQTYIGDKNYIKNIKSQIYRCVSKQRSNPFYVSVYRQFEWLEKIVMKSRDNIDYERMEHISVTTRLRILKPLKNLVWSRYASNHSMYGLCYVCKSNITYDNFECGHIISVFYGGETHIDNLRPLCHTCNSDMSIMNLEDYKSKLEESVQPIVDFDELD